MLHEKKPEQSAAAGKYALDMRSADQEKATAAAMAAQQRGKYYIMPKSEGQMDSFCNG